MPGEMDPVAATSPVLRRKAEVGVGTSEWGREPLRKTVKWQHRRQRNKISLSTEFHVKDQIKLTRQINCTE